MMEQFFIRIFNMGLTAGITILVVFLIRLIIKKAPKIFSYALWAVVLFRLLCPVSFSSVVSLMGVLNGPEPNQGMMEYIPENIGLMEQPEVNLPIGAVENAVNESLPAAAMENSANPMQIVIFAGACIWIAGIAAMLMYGIVTYIKLLHRLSVAVNERDNIFHTSNISMPFVCGIIRPRIYLPTTLGEEEKRYILLHEQIHIRRGDHIWRIISFLALCLHWFNPLVWLAFFASGKDMEMSCDEAVIRRIGDGVKKEYSASLLALASGKKIVPGIPLAFGEGETKGRIKNILHYNKPAKIAVGVVVALLAVAAITLIANPISTADGSGNNDIADSNGDSEIANGGEDLDSEKKGEVFYGVVSNVDVEGVNRMLITIPGLGDVEIPEAEEVYPYIEIEDYDGLDAGYLVQITFPEGEEVLIQETYPASFNIPAKSIVVMGEGFILNSAGNGRYLFTVPLGLARDAGIGDTLEIYYHDAQEGYYIDKEAGDEKVILATTKVLRVDAENYDIFVELSLEETRLFLSMFGHGISCSVIKNDGQYIITPEEEIITLPSERNIGGGLSDGVYRKYLDGTVADGVYRIYVRSISRSARGVDRYITDDMDAGKEQLFLAFADDCLFLTNKDMNGLSYEETSFDDFADLAGELFSHQNPPMLLKFEDGLITEAVLENYYGGGISFDALPQDTWYEDIQKINSMDGTEALNEFYTLESTESMDIGDGEGEEQISVYTGNIGDGDSGIVLFESADGELLYTLSAHCARAGWNNIYAGERDGVGFIMIMHIENRDNFGNYAYHVFRLDENGNTKLIAGSSFDWGDYGTYDDELFYEWAEEMRGYLADGHLLLSTQEGEINTEHISEADKYNYDMLKPE